MPIKIQRAVRKLKVRLTMWDRDRHIQYLAGSRWETCRKLDDTRDYARQHGYSGITITVT